MLSFREYLLEADRQKVIKNIESQGMQINIHLIKILYFDNPRDLEHHLNDLNSFIKKVVDNIKDVKLSESVIYNLLKRDKKTLKNYLTKINNSGYKNFKTLDIFDNVVEHIDDIIKNISYDLSQNEFITIYDELKEKSRNKKVFDIRDYI